MNGEIDRTADLKEAGNDPEAENSQGAGTVETGEQHEQTDLGRSKSSQSDHIYDSVDANVVSNPLQDENRTKLTSASSFDQEKEQSSTIIQGEHESNTAVPKIEIIEGSTTLSDSSSDDDSDAREERRKKKLTKKKKSDENRSDDYDDVDELRSQIDSLSKENETNKERVENILKEKMSLEESLEDERSKTQVITVGKHKHVRRCTSNLAQMLSSGKFSGLYDTVIGSLYSRAVTEGQGQKFLAVQSTTHYNCTYSET